MAAGIVAIRNDTSTNSTLRSVEDIDHSRTKTKSPQTNGICEPMIHLLDRLIRDRAVAISAALFQQVTLKNPIFLACDLLKVLSELLKQLGRLRQPSHGLTDSSFKEPRHRRGSMRVNQILS